jgi:uncharacterized protein (TIGR01777 family)
MQKVLITGGTGLIGKTLTRHLIEKGYEVIILTRKANTSAQIPLINYFTWNIKKQIIDGAAISKADYIIHLSGAGVMDKKWTEKYKKEIVESRTKSSDLLIKGLKENTNHVKAIISSSAIGWYGESKKNRSAFIESDMADESFLGQTCKLWEESIEPATLLNIRLVKLRLGIVISNEGGALQQFKKPLQFGVAGILGSGEQIISWIHVDDVCRMFIYAMENENLDGTYNAVAPETVSNKTFILKLAGQMRKNFYVPVHVPEFAIKLLLGDRSIEILKSSRVSCEKIKNDGFIYLYPAIDDALKKLFTN